MLQSLQRAAALLALATFVLPGCGASNAAPKAAETAPFPNADLSTPEGAVAAVTEAERAIDQMLPPPPGVSQIGQQQGAFPSQQWVSPQASVQPAPPPPPPMKPEADAPAGKKAGPAPTVTGTSVKEEALRSATGAGPATALDSCSTACSALASMERAADRLCGLTGPGDARCTDARSRVQNAGSRVHAACPACAG